VVLATSATSAPLPPAPPPLALPPRLLLLVQLEGALPWRPALLLLLVPRSSRQVRRPPPPGWIRALEVWRPLPPDLWVRLPLVLARAQTLLELLPIPQQGKKKVQAGDRTPQLERRRRTRWMRACHMPTVLGPGRQMEK
jgi:hypothetical protein